MQGKTATRVTESVLRCEVPCLKYGTAVNCNVLQKSNEINDKDTVKSPMWGRQRKTKHTNPTA